MEGTAPGASGRARGGRRGGAGGRQGRGQDAAEATAAVVRRTRGAGMKRGRAKGGGRGKGKAAALSDNGDVQGEEEDLQAEQLPILSYRGMFEKDLPLLMYGFGDAETPIQQTVDVVEDMLVEYVSDMCNGALAAAAHAQKLSERDKASGISRLKLDEKDLLMLVRKDERKFTRIKELLTMQEVIRNARKGFDPENLDVEAGDGEGEQGGQAEDLDGDE